MPLSAAALAAFIIFLILSPSMIIGNPDTNATTVEKLSKLNPLVLDVLPLTLEEVFTYEMEALGYEFDTALEVELDGQY